MANVVNNLIVIENKDYFVKLKDNNYTYKHE